MIRLYSSDEIVKGLERNGFRFVKQKGSHAKYRKIGNPTLTVIVPMDKKEVPTGTFRAILRQSQLSEANIRKK